MKKQPKIKFEEEEINFYQIEEIVSEGHCCKRDSKVIKMINQDDFGILAQRFAEKRGVSLKEAASFLLPFYA